jgi:hypothetical protein
MQVNHIDTAQLADLLGQSEILDMSDAGSQRLYVLAFDGQDILAVADSMSGGAFVIYPPESFDLESGGSIHAHARAACDG